MFILYLSHHLNKQSHMTVMLYLSTFKAFTSNQLKCFSGLICLDKKYLLWITIFNLTTDISIRFTVIVVKLSNA